MPCLVTSYEQGAKWKDAPIGKSLASIAEEKGVKFISWIWQAGGIASAKAIRAPDDIKGMKVCGGSREMDLVFGAAGVGLDRALGRNLPRHAEGRARCGADLLDKPDFLPAGRTRQGAHHRSRGIDLVDVPTASDVQGRFGACARAAESHHRDRTEMEWSGRH